MDKIVVYNDVFSAVLSGGLIGFLILWITKMLYLLLKCTIRVNIWESPSKIGMVGRYDIQEGLKKSVQVCGMHAFGTIKHNKYFWWNNSNDLYLWNYYSDPKLFIYFCVVMCSEYPVFSLKYKVTLWLKIWLHGSPQTETTKRVSRNLTHSLDICFQHGVF